MNPIGAKAKSVKFLSRLLLTDSDGQFGQIISVRGKEAGLDHLEITVQSDEEKEMDIATRHRIYTEEIETTPEEEVF